MFMRDEHSHRAREQKPLGAGSWPTSSRNRRQHFNGKQRCKRTSSGNKRPGSYVAAATIIVAVAPPPTEPSGLYASLGRRPATSPSFLPPIHPPRVQRALQCAKPWAEHWAPNPQSSGSGAPLSLPPAPDGCSWWGFSPPKGSRKPSPESRREAQLEAARPGLLGARVSEAAGSRVWRSGGSAALSAAPLSGPTPLQRGSSLAAARGEGGATRDLKVHRLWSGSRICSRRPRPDRISANSN